MATIRRIVGAARTGEEEVKVNAFYLSSTISATVQEILVDIVTYIINGWVQNRLEDADCS